MFHTADIWKLSPFETLSIITSQLAGTISDLATLAEPGPYLAAQEKPLPIQHESSSMFYQFTGFTAAGNDKDFI